MANPSWNEMYASRQPMPWDSGVPDPMLVELVEARVISPGRALDVGCGTGTNAIYLAQRGFDVTGIDLAPEAIVQARAKANGAVGVRFEACDFLASPPVGSYDLVFDRGCFHCFDAPEERSRFAENVAGLLAKGGRWVSLIGSTEGPPRDTGPPRRSARDVLHAIEPSLELLQLRSAEFDVQSNPVKAWVCIATKR